MPAFAPPNLRVVALMPAWKAEAFITPVLESLAAQTYLDLLVLISDDASPDGTAAICESFAARDSRFRVIRQPRNLGWIGNVNALLTAAQDHGDAYFFAFHDDFLDPEYVSSLAAALAEHPDAVIAFSDLRLRQANGEETIVTYRWLDGVKDRVTRGRLVAGKKGRWWIPNRGLFRAWAAYRIGGLKRHAAGESLADWPWLLHMTLLGDAIRVPRVLCTKVFSSDSISLKWTRSVPAFWAVARSCAREVGRSRLSFTERLPLYAGLWRLVAQKALRAVMVDRMRAHASRPVADGRRR